VKEQRPQRVTFLPERVLIPQPARDVENWIIKNISFVSLINEDLLTKAYADDRRKAGRKAGRKIRRQRRKLRRTNAEFGHKPGEGVPESILRAKVVVR
jgi:hypothetical protein